MRKSGLIFFLSLLLSSSVLQAQPLTIDQCYELARKNYPLIKQKELLVKSMEFTIANAQSGYLPQVTIYGQATYQSDVTRLPVSGIPGLGGVEPLSKDQYKVYGELNQTIYDGGAIKNQASVQTAGTLVEQQKVEVELYKIKERINQLFFGVLLMDAQLVQVDLLKDDLKTSLAKTESAIRNGTAFKTNADILQAELLKSDQRIIEMKSARKGYLDMLGYFINQTLGDNTILEKPAIILFEKTASIKRPELTLYQFQSDLIGAQYKSNTTRNMPKLGFFVQGGYGKPALNQLNNSFDTYYLGGVRMSWALSGFYNSKRDKQLLDVNAQVVNTQKDIFLFNTDLTLKQQSQEVYKLQDLITVDNQIIELRVKIKNTSKSQHENGVISTSDYLRELNAEDASKQNLLLHQVQLMLAQYNYQTTTGN
ncbi:MAG: TolC family protein [Cyclobacteriaceae bacterium]|nr:TolC family protein [Cyclobacteriaceae bacterium]